VGGELRGHGGRQISIGSGSANGGQNGGLVAVEPGEHHAPRRAAGCCCDAVVGQADSLGPNVTVEVGHESFQILVGTVHAVGEVHRVTQLVDHHEDDVGRASRL